MTYEFSPWIICAIFSIAGGVLGVVLDLYRVFRYFCRPGRWLTACGDILYWAMVTGALFGLFHTVVNGELRLYFFLFLLLGIAIYYCWFSRAFIRFYRMLGNWLIASVRAIARLIRTVLGVIFAPLAWLVGMALGVLRWLMRPLARPMEAVRRWWQSRRPPAPPLE